MVSYQDFGAALIDEVVTPAASVMAKGDIGAPTAQVRERDADGTRCFTVTTLRALTLEQWHGVGLGSSDGAERDIRNLASRPAHECVHHSLDMARSE